MSGTFEMHYLLYEVRSEAKETAENLKKAVLHD